MKISDQLYSKLSLDLKLFICSDSIQKKMHYLKEIDGM